MKTSLKYNKSEIMKEAWWLYKSVQTLTFSQCLVNSWNQAKGVNYIADNLKLNSVKDIHDLLLNKEAQQVHKMTYEEILEVVSEKSNGFQSDIATKAINGKSMTEKQAWCVAYEYKKVA